MALFKIKKGLAANLPANSTEGYCYVTTDDHKFYVDLSTATSASLTSRICLNAAQADTSLDGVEYINGTQTAATGTWTGVTRSPALYVGKTIAYRLPKNGSGNASLILTLADGSQTSAYAVYAGNTRLTTHYPAGTVMVMTWTGTDWRTNAYYDTNTNTLQRTYALASTTELPIVGASTSTAGEYTAFTTGSKDLYGVIPNNTSKVATINPSTGHITVPGGITATLTGDCTGTAGSVLWDNVTSKPDTYAPKIGSTATTAAAGNHTHTTSLAAGGTATINLAANTAYKLTAGGTTVIFKTPADTTTNYYHTTGSWSNFTYTATANGGAGALAFTLPTGTTATTVAVGNHNHDSTYLKLSGGTLTGALGLRTTVTKGTNPSAQAGSHIQILETGTGTAEANRLGMLYCYVDTSGIVRNRIYAYRYLANSTANTYFGLYISANGATKKTETDALIYGAVWNDYAELRKTNKEAQPGQCVVDNDDGSLNITDKRLLPGVSVVSDTFGFAIGETETTKTPLAVSGRVLVYPYRDRSEYHAGMAVCSAPNGTVDIMTREEIMMYPDCIVGIVSEIPEYDTWGTGNVKVNNRIWIKVR